MKYRLMKLLETAFLAVAFVSLAASAATGATITRNFTADKTTVTMPDGRVIPVWGFVDNDAPGLGVQFPGPRIDAEAGDTLNINLSNNLGVPVSLHIPGQMTAMSPVWMNDAADPWGASTSNTRPNPNARVRSLTHETPAGGGPVLYTWTNVAAETYLYQSATHAALQVQMGLYGAFTVNTPAGMAYPGHPFDEEALLLFSELDSAIHDAADDTSPSTFPVTNVYAADYWLVNGMPYSPGASPLFTGTPGNIVLLRLLNAGLRSHNPLLQGQHAMLIAEDGKPLPFARQTYTFPLHAGKTLDAKIMSAPDGYLAIFDRRHDVTNAGSYPGGNIAFLNFPPGGQFTLTVAKDGTGTGTISAAAAPGGINCGTDCSETVNAGTAMRLTPMPDPGSVLVGWSDPSCPKYGDCEVTVNASATVTGTFKAFRKTKVLTPNGGERINGGDVVTIWWGAPARAATSKLQYFRRGKWRSIARRVTGNSYVWTAPDVRKRTRAYVKVTSFNARGKRIGSDRSNRLFVIRPAP